MGETFDRVAVAPTPDGTEYIVLETQLMLDFGDGQGPKGGVVTIQDGWVAVRGPGEARLHGGSQEQGGNFPPQLILIGEKGQPAVEIAAYPDPTGQPHFAKIYLEGSGGNAWLGGNGADGDLVLLPSKATKQEAGQAGIHLSAEDRLVRIGSFTGFAPKDEIQLDGQNHRVRISGPDPADETGMGPNVARVVLDATKAGLLQLRDGQGTTTIELKAETGAGRFGGRGVNGDVLVFSENASSKDSGEAAVWIRGSNGDIVLRNADCAEEFDLAPGTDVEAGAVVVIDKDGQMTASGEPYDCSVAGVASGADGTQPGIILGHHPNESSRRLAVALAGRVGCCVDADYEPIQVGDMLTTSATRGHAMKAVDPGRAFGAIVGKALASVGSGRSVIPILVSLQ